MLIKDLERVTKDYTQVHGTGQHEATVRSFGSTNRLYDIQLRNDIYIRDAPGPVGLRIGDSVTVLVNLGKVNRYSIISEGWRARKRDVEVFI